MVAVHGSTEAIPVGAGVDADAAEAARTLKDAYRVDCGRTLRVSQPAPLRFPPGARLWSLQPLADPLTAALPPYLLARLRRAAPPSSQPSPS
eukprot:4476155-Prymnesium_polylepis.1